VVVELKIADYWQSAKCGGLRWKLPSVGTPLMTWERLTHQANSEAVNLRVPSHEFLEPEKHPALITLSDNPDHLIARGRIVDIISGMGTVFEAQSLTKDTQTAQQRITSVIRE
jgi:hypothetical protein